MRDDRRPAFWRSGAADSLYRRSLATFARAGGPDGQNALSTGYATMVSALERGMPLADSLYPELG